jgi:hypothetical protein
VISGKILIVSNFGLNLTPSVSKAQPLENSKKNLNEAFRFPLLMTLSEWRGKFRPLSKASGAWVISSFTGSEQSRATLLGNA